MVKKSSESSQHERQVEKKKESISSKRGKEIENLHQMQDSEIDYSDIPELDFNQLGEPLKSKFYRPLKKQISIRLDMDVLDWFQHADKRYQSLINKVCREYMEKNKKKAAGRKLSKS